MQELLAALTLIMTLSSGTVMPGLDTDQAYGASFEKTMEITAFANDVIDTYHHTLPDLKIACFGDSITQGQEQGSYPDVLKRILGTETVYNYGVGGSSIGNYWLEPMCIRYEDLPDDLDVLVIAGGINDSYVLKEDKFGAIGQEGTFCGDLDRLLTGVKEKLPDTKILFYMLPPTYERERLELENPGLISQELLRVEIAAQCRANDIDVIDAYSLNFLNPYDPEVRQKLYRDSTHPNGTGYELMACFIASRIVLWAQETGFGA